MHLVTIGLVTYNRSHLIVRSISSVLNQTFKDFELIISDDNSTDSTAEVVAPFLTDKRVYYVTQPGIGMTQNFLEVLKLANGKYFMWLCDDDYISEDYLEKTMEFLQQHKDYSLACGTTKFFDKNGVWDQKELLELEDEDGSVRVKKYFLKVNTNIILYGLMRREEINGFIYPDTFCADFFWSSQIALIGKVKILEDTLFYYSKEGISSDSKQLAEYYHQSRRAKNPYLIVRQVAFNIINKRQGAFEKLNVFESKFLAARVWLIIRDRFCLSTIEAKIRHKLGIEAGVINF